MNTGYSKGILRLLLDEAGTLNSVLPTLNRRLTHFTRSRRLLVIDGTSGSGPCTSGKDSGVTEVRRLRSLSAGVLTGTSCVLVLLQHLVPVQVLLPVFDHFSKDLGHIRDVASTLWLS